MIVIGMATSYVPAYADCGGEASELDAECNTACGGGEGEASGCYLPPTPGNACPESFPNRTEDGICCCK